MCVAGSFVLGTHSAYSQSSTDVVRGPFYSGTITAAGRNAQPIAAKGVVVTVGTDKKAWVCYDTDLLRVTVGWTGSYLDFKGTQTQIAWPPPPSVRETPLFSNMTAPGWSKNKSFEDPRPNHQGPLPKDWAHYTGLYQNGDQVIFSYKVGENEVLDMPGYEGQPGAGAFTRTLNIKASKVEQSIAILDAPAGASTDLLAKTEGKTTYVTVGGSKKMAIVVAGAEKDLTFDNINGQISLKIPSHSKTLRMKVFIASVADDAAAQALAAGSQGTPLDLSSLCKGGPSHWNELVTTQGTLGTNQEAYVVDTITEPFTNPYNAKTFFGGFDFFEDGRAAICTFHGDVWVVSGLDSKLDKITWKRFATGLFQPLGLKIVKETVYVLGRDQITILKDLNKDGEADYYQNFNNDTVVTENYHEFCLDLWTDPDGNFYFCKGAPWEPNVTSPSQGCMFKVAKDGSKMEVIATGLRAPNGMAVGPHGELTVSDNQGHWMPASKLDWVEKGGFYGMTPSAQKDITLVRNGTNFLANPSKPEDRAKFGIKGWLLESPIPQTYDQPMAWIPYGVDNSSGGQVWVNSDKWGPLKDKLLFMSYGKCTLFEVMPDKVDGTRQAAMVQLPLKFNTGIMRGRVNPKDGQIYVAGLKGWQTSAANNGGFYRVRHTEYPTLLPLAWHAAKGGMKLTFSTELDPKTAADAGNYSAQQWNYFYSGNYGSPDFSVATPTKKGRDTIEVKSARLLPDGKSVWLEIPELAVADQFNLKYNIEAKSGGTLKQDVFGTVHKLADK
ncbi:MAG: hypothetical protein JWN25_2628 [Verrucomicrobiales bacterium]|nr:hypothetical protein [Verrucomicrobiales bacterium]